jgi:hypothetical protein
MHFVPFVLHTAIANTPHTQRMTRSHETGPGMSITNICVQDVQDTDPTRHEGLVIYRATERDLK